MNNFQSICMAAFLTAGITVPLSSAYAQSDGSASYQAIVDVLDKKYAKKYDSWDDLSSRSETVEGMYKENCKKLKAKFCKQLETSASNMDIPNGSRPEAIYDRSKKACKGVGGKFKPVRASTTEVEDFFMSNASMADSGKYITKGFVGVCMVNGEAETLVSSLGYVKRTSGSGSYFSAKGRSFIYITDLKAMGCIEDPLQAGDETTEGLIIEVKGVVAQVQRTNDVKWMKLDDLKPVTSRCSG